MFFFFLFCCFLLLINELQQRVLVLILTVDFVMQRSGDESAVLWLDQIQEAIHTANQDQEDAQKCMIVLFT